MGFADRLARRAATTASQIATKADAAARHDILSGGADLSNHADEDSNLDQQA